MQQRNRRVLLGLTIATLAILGCGGETGPELAPVTGVITLDGQPLPRVNVRFIPEREGGSPSVGGTNAEGRYTLHFSHNKLGAMLGTHRVEVEARDPEKGDNGKLVNPGEKGIVIPRKYQQAGALTAEVKAGRNTIDFALQSR